MLHNIAFWELYILSIMQISSSETFFQKVLYCVCYDDGTVDQKVNLNDYSYRNKD